MIATDYDREGELIGLEALEQILDVEPQRSAQRESEPSARAARRSSAPATRRSPRRRSSAPSRDLDELSYDLAYAGAARQDIDLIWGATLTRAVSLATRRFGSNFLSVGRVQSPTLGADRRARARAPRPRRRSPTGRCSRSFQHPDGSFEAHHATDKFWEKAEAEAALAGTKSPGVVKEVSSQAQHAQAADAVQHHRLHHRRLEPARHHAGARRCGSPRTSTWTGSSPTRAPTTPSIRSRSTLASWSARSSGSRTSRPRRRCSTATLDARPAARRRPPTTRRSTRRRRVYPSALDGPEGAASTSWSCAASSPPSRQPMITESTRADIEAGTRDATSCAARSWSTPASPRSTPTPAPRTRRSRSSRRARSSTLDGDPWMVDKETQPPSRISQGKLIEMMEERGLGTKATRADIIQKLYDRGYVFRTRPSRRRPGSRCTRRSTSTCRGWRRRR